MTEPVDTPDPAAQTPSKRGRGRLVVAGGAVAVAVLMGGGAFAYSMLAGGGSQPADVMPSTMQAYARLDLDPSANQKIALFKLVRKIPEAAKEIGDAEDVDLRRLVLEDLLDEECKGLDYESDVEPWLGKRIGVGANLSKEQVLVAAQVTDEAKARKGIDALSDCSGQEIGLAFVDGYALMSDSQKSVDAAIDASKKGTLGDDENFTADMDDLGEPGIASFWFDGKSLADGLKKSGLAPAEAAQLDQIKDLGSSAGAIRVAGSAIELAAVSDTTKAYDVDPAPIGDLPADTVLALSLSGLGPQVEKQFDTFRDSLDQSLGAFTGGSGPAAQPIDPDVLADLDPATRDAYEKMMQESEAPPMSVDDLLDRFETESGLRLPDDLATLLGKTFTLAVGRANLEKLPQLQGADDLAQLDLAIRSQSDPTRAKAVMDKLADLADDNGVALVSEQTDDGAVLATNSKAATSLLNGGKLGDGAAFGNVMPYGDDTLQGIYVDAAAIIDAVRAADPPPDVKDGLKQVEAISGAGFSVGRISDDRLGFSLRVGFKD